MGGGGRGDNEHVDITGGEEIVWVVGGGPPEALRGLFRTLGEHISNAVQRCSRMAHHTHGVNLADTAGAN